MVGVCDGASFEPVSARASPDKTGFGVSGPNPISMPGKVLPCPSPRAIRIPQARKSHEAARFHCAFRGVWSLSKQDDLKLSNGQSPISNAQRLCWRRARRLMSAAEIVVLDIQRDRRNVIVQFLRESVGQSSEAPAAHTDRKVLAFNVAGRNVLLRIA